MTINEITALTVLVSGTQKYIFLRQVSSTDIEVLNHPDNANIGGYIPEISRYDIRDFNFAVSTALQPDYTSAAFNGH
jgi:hypothetical protein